MRAAAKQVQIPLKLNTRLPSLRAHHTGKGDCYLDSSLTLHFSGLDDFFYLSYSNAHHGMCQQIDCKFLQRPRQCTVKRSGENLVMWVFLRMCWEFDYLESGLLLLHSVLFIGFVLIWRWLNRYLRVLVYHISVASSFSVLQWLMPLGVRRCVRKV